MSSKRIKIEESAVTFHFDRARLTSLVALGAVQPLGTASSVPVRYEYNSEADTG